jgi:hypothetical protein
MPHLYRDILGSLRPTVRPKNSAGSLPSGKISSYRAFTPRGLTQGYGKIVTSPPRFGHFLGDPGMLSVAKKDWRNVVPNCWLRRYGAYRSPAATPRKNRALCSEPYSPLTRRRIVPLLHLLSCTGSQRRPRRLTPLLLWGQPQSRDFLSGLLHFFVRKRGVIGADIALAGHLPPPGEGHARHLQPRSKPVHVTHGPLT